MSPEQVRGEGVGAKSDVWSLGCLVYEMCALNPPFLASNPLQLARKIERGEWDEAPVRRYGEDMLQCVRAMMAVDATDRWSVDDVLTFTATRYPSSEEKRERSERPSRTREDRPDVEQRMRTLTEKERKVKEREERVERRERAIQQRELEVQRRERAMTEAEGRRRSLQVHRRTTLTASPSFPPSPPLSPASSTSSSSFIYDSPSTPLTLLTSFSHLPYL